MKNENKNEVFKNKISINGSFKILETVTFLKFDIFLCKKTYAAGLLPIPLMLMGLYDLPSIHKFMCRDLMFKDDLS